MPSYSNETFELTRFALQKGISFVYLLAFINIINQFIPLLGENGLLPIKNFIRRTKFKNNPSLFYFWDSDIAIKLLSYLGILLSVLVFLDLFGLSDMQNIWLSMSIWALLWVLYLSFVNVGQTFYSFGWESMLLEAGFLAIFLGPASLEPSSVTIWLFRWFLFRVMFGAGLIKLRGDKCWRDLSCMTYFYETQPIPNPLSRFFHFLPKTFHKSSVFMNHIIELIIPFFFFAPQPIAGIAGLITLGFHGWLMLSGNFAFLGVLTIVLCLSTFSDSWLTWVFDFSYVIQETSLILNYSNYLLGLLILFLSYKPIKNLISKYQLMNTSFDSLHLVGSYGAFGSVTKPRYEIIIEGTENNTIWQEYEFYGKPGNINKVGKQIAPYHLRLDWLMWFAAFGTPAQHPWFERLLFKLLQGDQKILKLFKSNPFKTKPPKYIRALLYLYEFDKNKNKAWRRKLVGTYFPAVSLVSDTDT